MKSLLLALHAVYPCATLSDSVIMPDHIHFLLIVNYDLMPGFNPLWVVHRVMDATEQIWKERGQAPAPPEAAALLRAAIQRGRDRAAEIKARMMSQQGCGGAAPVRSTLRFDRHAYIELSFDTRQLKAIRHYIRLNQARALWKLMHPDRFVRFVNIRHAVLDPARTWDAMGNLTLLGSPFLFHVRLTLKKSLAEHEAAICEIVEKAKRGMVPVSGFISPGEVEALKRLKVTPGTRFIKVLPCSLPPRYDPSAEDSRELAADRLLILSGFRNTRHISALAMRRDPATAHLFRSNCLAMNDLAAALCERAQTRTDRGRPHRLPPEDERAL
ncbi:MAG: hypothetical protein MJ240_09210 [Kiritimatiellae bacterium]|nr:hypothetical protein [Kiritimatiellia bacterium]